jgi:hypothetical protein
MDLAIDAVDRQVLERYGEWLDIDGVRVPAWLIVDGADATGEALLGLAAYASATGNADATTALRQLGEGVALMRSGDSRVWPYGAVLPWSLSQSVWHAWGGLPPAGLAKAYEVTGDRRLIDAARSDTASFTPHLLIAAGPENGWLPSPSDHVQIAYGAHSRVESLLATAEAGDRPGLREVAGVAAAWFFGNNPAGEAMYDPATGRTYDGVNGDGVVNFNSGAESTIHGLLAMMALDAMPDVLAIARVAGVVDRRTWSLVEAESGQLGSGATRYQPASAWTGESLWSGGVGVRMAPSAQVTLPVTASGPNLLMPVVFLHPSAGESRWSTGRRLAGTVHHDAVGPQGNSPAPGMLAVETLERTVRDVSAVTVSASRAEVLVDALLVQPEVEHLVLTDDASSTALVRNVARHRRAAEITLPAGETATVSTYDSTGRLVSERQSPASRVVFDIPPGGFAVARS